MIHMRKHAAVFCVALAGVMFAEVVHAQTVKGDLTKGKLQIAKHETPLEAGLYRFKVVADGFTPRIDLRGTGVRHSAVGNKKEVSFIYAVKKPGTFQVLVSNGKPSAQNAVKTKYTLTIERAEFQSALAEKKKLTPAIHAFQMNAGYLYRIAVHSNGFVPIVRVTDAAKMITRRIGKQQAGKKYAAADLVFEPSKTDAYQIVVSQKPFQTKNKPRNQELDYTIKVTKEKLLLSKIGNLLKNDPKRDGKHFDVYKIKMQPGRVYVISMTGLRFLDAYLILENAQEFELAKDNDSGGDRNAQIVYQNILAGEYRIIVTTTTRGRTGGYRLIVTERDTLEQ